MTERTLSLAVNGREYQLKGRLVLFEAPGMDPGPGPWGGNGAGSVAIVGLGYVGLPAVAALHGRCGRIIGVDANRERLREIEAGEADLSGPDRARLDAALGDGSLELTCDPAAVAKADAVIICVPTPVDDDHAPNLCALRAARHPHPRAQVPSNRASGSSHCSHVATTPRTCAP